MDVLSGHSDFVEMREPYSKDSCLTADMLGSDSYGCGDNYVFFFNGRVFLWWSCWSLWETSFFLSFVGVCADGVRLPHDLQIAAAMLLGILRAFCSGCAQLWSWRVVSCSWPFHHMSLLRGAVGEWEVVFLCFSDRIWIAWRVKEWKVNLFEEMTNSRRNIKRITRLLVFELGWLFFQPFGLRARYLFHGRKGNAIFASVSKTPMATVKGYHSYPLFIVAVAVTFVATLWKTVPIFCFLVSKAHAVFF